MHAQEGAPDEGPPCEQPDGILPDGTCQFGFIDLDPLGLLAVELWLDKHALGDALAPQLVDISLSQYERGEVLARLRVIADTQAAYLAKKRKPKGG